MTSNDSAVLNFQLAISRKYSFLVCACVHACGRACLVTSVVSDSVTLWTVACQAPLSMGFSGQEYWSELPCSPPGDLPNPGIKPVSSAFRVENIQKFNTLWFRVLIIIIIMRISIILKSYNLQ